MKQVQKCNETGMAKRKPESYRRTEIISIRITAEEKEALLELATSNKMKLPDYMRHLLIMGIYP